MGMGWGSSLPAAILILPPDPIQELLDLALNTTFVFSL